jgi:hypothetical protein
MELLPIVILIILFLIGAFRRSGEISSGEISEIENETD